MRYQETTSDFTSTMPKNIPATRYFNKCHQECFISDSFMQMASSDRTSKSVLVSGITVLDNCSLVCIAYNCKMTGSIKLALMSPPIIKQMVAINDGSCKLERPIMV